MRNFEHSIPVPITGTDTSNFCKLETTKVAIGTTTLRRVYDSWWIVRISFNQSQGLFMERSFRIQGLKRALKTYGQWQRWLTRLKSVDHRLLGHLGFKGYDK